MGSHGIAPVVPGAGPVLQDRCHKLLHRAVALQRWPEREADEARSTGISGNNTDAKPKRSEKLSGMKKDADTIVMSKVFRCIHQNRVVLLTKTVRDHCRRRHKFASMRLPVYRRMQ